MANTTEKVFDVINNLIESNRNAQQGYRDAAGKVSDPTMRTYFNERSLERGQYAAQLKNELQRLGKADISNSGTAMGAIRRAWLDLKANLGGANHARLSFRDAAET